MPKYEVWGRKDPRQRSERLAYGFQNESEARKSKTEFDDNGFQDCVVVQRPPRYGRIDRLQKAGRE